MNVVVRKSSRSETVSNARTAAKANDGIINGGDFYRSVNDGGDQWWRVDLDTQYFIVRVLVFNRDTSLSKFCTIKFISVSQYIKYAYI